MNAFQPLINLLVVITVLSVAAERIANALKLGSPTLEKPRRRLSRRKQKERERRIAKRALAASVLLAFVVKADFFALVSGADAPWETLGWSRSALRSLPDLVSTVAGTTVTGLALSFGSKFWHDVLDLVYGVRTAVTTGRTRGAARSPAASRTSDTATETAS